METDLGKSFTKLIDQTFINYRGCLIEKVPGGYLYNRATYPTLQEIDQAISNSLSIILKSIQS